MSNIEDRWLRGLWQALQEQRTQNSERNCPAERPRATVKLSQRNWLISSQGTITWRSKVQDAETIQECISPKKSTDQQPKHHHPEMQKTETVRLSQGALPQRKDYISGQGTITQKLPKNQSYPNKPDPFLLIPTDMIWHLDAETQSTQQRRCIIAADYQHRDLIPQQRDWPQYLAERPAPDPWQRDWLQWAHLDTCSLNSKPGLHCACSYSLDTDIPSMQWNGLLRDRDSPLTSTWSCL